MGKTGGVWENFKWKESRGKEEKERGRRYRSSYSFSSLANNDRFSNGWPSRIREMSPRLLISNTLSPSEQEWEFVTWTFGGSFSRSTAQSLFRAVYTRVSFCGPY